MSIVLTPSLKVTYVAFTIGIVQVPVVVMYDALCNLLFDDQVSLSVPMTHSIQLPDHDINISRETFAAIRASSTCLCWKRACDLPKHLRVMQGRCRMSGEPSVELSYSAVFPPTNTLPLRGVVLFLHGVNEHSERYFHVFDALCAMGFGVIAYDLRSHGKSHMDVPGLIGHMNHFQSAIDDTNDFLTFAKREIFPTMGARADEKLVIMGMSLGTLVSVHTVLSKHHAFSGIVLTAPAVSVEMTAFLNVVGLASGALAMVAPEARLVPAVNVEAMCRDPLVNSDFDADPLTTRKPITCRMGHETLAFMTALQQDKTVEDPSSAFAQIPLLMMMGTQDKVTSLPVARQFYERVATQDKLFELIDGAYHVLFEDFERAHVLQIIEQWLHQRFPQLPSF